jgi:hypothetical protein
MANRAFQLSVQGILNSSYRETVLHFQSTGTNDNDTLAAAESLCNGWHTAVRALWLATLPPTYFLVRLAARRVQLKPSATGCKYYGIGLDPGTRGADAGPQQTCPSIFLVPTMGVKSGGRIFWPSIPQGDLIQSALAAGWQTAVDAAIAAMVTGFTNAGITWTLCVFSRKLGTISNVASHNYSPVIGYQGRRRKPIGAV